MVKKVLNPTNEKIRYVAFRLFLENGYEATNIRDICLEVDIKTSSLYFYYQSKKELFFSIYDTIWKENIAYRQQLEEEIRETNPEEKLSTMYKKMIEYYAKDIVNQKFLLRYSLFPPVEIRSCINERHKSWTSEENSIVMRIVKQCLDCKILSDKRIPIDYVLEYKKNEYFEVMHMIISSMKISKTELLASWRKCWESMLGTD